MDERRKRIVEALGLKQSDFEKSQTASDRMTDLEEAILELSELIGGDSE